VTTILTTTGSDNLPHYPILRSAYGQVSHGMPQPGCSLQAEDQRGTKRQSISAQLLASAMSHPSVACGAALPSHMDLGGGAPSSTSRSAFLQSSFGGWRLLPGGQPWP
jgi:hypothetical protein